MQLRKQNRKLAQKTQIENCLASLERNALDDAAFDSLINKTMNKTLDKTTESRIVRVRAKRDTLLPA